METHFFEFNNLLEVVGVPRLPLPLFGLRGSFIDGG